MFDELITVDPHLHRIQRLEAAVPVNEAVTLRATDAMSAYLEDRLINPILVGPDEESRQWVAAIAKRNGLECHVARKQRLGDSDVNITVPEADIRGRHVVLVDDIVSTGRTLEAACRQLGSQQPASMTVMVTHALFVGDAEKRIRNAGANDIWSCDSIVHATNRIRLADSIAAALLDL